MKSILSIVVLSGALMCSVAYGATSSTPGNNMATFVTPFLWDLPSNWQSDEFEVRQYLIDADYVVTAVDVWGTPDDFVADLPPNFMIPVLGGNMGVFHLHSHGSSGYGIQSPSVAIEAYPATTPQESLTVRLASLATMYGADKFTSGTVSTNSGGTVKTINYFIGDSTSSSLGAMDDGVGAFAQWFQGDHAIVYMQGCGVHNGNSDWSAVGGDAWLDYSANVTPNTSVPDANFFWRAMAGYSVPSGGLDTRTVASASQRWEMSGLLWASGSTFMTLRPALRSVAPDTSTTLGLYATGQDIEFEFDTFVSTSGSASYAFDWYGDIDVVDAEWEDDGKRLTAVVRALSSQANGYIVLKGSQIHSPRSATLTLDRNGIVPVDQDLVWHFGFSTPIGDSFTATPDVDSGSYGIDLSWTESDTAGAYTYTLSRATSCYGPYNEIAAIQSTGTSAYTFLDSQYNQPPYGYPFAPDYTPPQYFTTYYYRIETGFETNFDSDSGCYDWWQCEDGYYQGVTAATPPSTPAWFSVDAFGVASNAVDVVLSWPTAIGPVTEYDVFRSRFVPLACYQQVLEHVATVPADTSQEYMWVDPSVDSDTPYYYWVVASNDETSAAATPQVTWTLDPTGAPAVGGPREAYVRVLSNGRYAPTVECGVPADARGTLEVYDVAGRKVATLQSDAPGPHVYRTRWHDQTRERTAAGVYFAVLTVDGRRVGTDKIVVVR